MRLLSFGFAGVAIAASAASGCAAVSGLGDYDEVAAAPENTPLSPSMMGATEVEPEAAPGAIGAPSQTGDAGDDTGDVFVVESAHADAAPSDSTDVADAGSLADVDSDASPPCGPMTCQHCCKDGVCVGGRSVASCGGGGDECKDCTKMGGACTNGSCSVHVADAAPPPACNKNACGGCIAGYQTACCKSDGTCGCAVMYVGTCE